MKFNSIYDRDMSDDLIFESLDIETIVTDPTDYEPISKRIQRFFSGEFFVDPRADAGAEYDFDEKASDNDIDDAAPDITNTDSVNIADLDEQMYQLASLKRDLSKKKQFNKEKVVVNDNEKAKVDHSTNNNKTEKE